MHQHQERTPATNATEHAGSDTREGTHTTWIQGKVEETGSGPTAQIEGPQGYTGRGKGEGGRGRGGEKRRRPSAAQQRELECCDAVFESLAVDGERGQVACINQASNRHHAR